MQSIKEILSSLSKNDARHIQYAFNNNISNTYIEYTPGRFIGVHIRDSLTSVQIEQRAGYYSEGSIVRNANS